MKISNLLFVALCGFIALAIVLVHRQENPSPVPEARSSVTAEPASAAEKPAGAQVDAAKTIPQTAEPPAQTQTPTAAANGTPADDAAKAIRKIVDGLLSARTGPEKRALIEQLRKSGQWEAAIADLQQRAAQNPDNAEIPTTLGEVQLNELRALRETGNIDNNALGILAMQADQNFNAALKINPQNWEAQFVKNISMSYWPANAERDNQVVQNLSQLIDQQETMAPNPDFAQTYVVLGNEYQKIGQPDKAMATWQLGLQKFPGDFTLQKKVNGQ